jgi:hypothetical protein
MGTFEQFENTTLKIMINVINAQSQEILFQRYLIYGLIGIWIIVGLSWIFRRFIRVERRRGR